MKSVFVSYVYEDKAFKDKLAAWAKEGRLGAVVITGETEDVRPQGQQAIAAHLDPKLRGAAAILVLVGRDTHNRPWVDHEVQFGKSHGVRVLPVRIPGTTGGTPVALRGARLVTFEPEALRNALA